MTPVDQTTFGDGRNGTEPGDCFRACVASVLDVPIGEVPNFVAEAAWFRALLDWLAPRGLWFVSMPATPAPWIPDGVHYIASGPAPRGVSHAVVMSDGLLVHDPHPSRDGLLSVERLGFFCVRR